MWSTLIHVRSNSHQDCCKCGCVGIGSHAYCASVWQWLLSPKLLSLESGCWLCIWVPHTLIVLAVILTIAGLIDLPTCVLYVAERVYSAWQPGLRAATLKGTAIWTLGKWFVCTTCSWTQVDAQEPWRARSVCKFDWHDRDGRRHNTASSNFVWLSWHHSRNCQLSWCVAVAWFVEADQTACQFCTQSIKYEGKVTAANEVQSLYPNTSCENPPSHSSCSFPSAAGRCLSACVLDGQHGHPRQAKEFIILLSLWIILAHFDSKAR